MKRDPRLLPVRWIRSSNPEFPYDASVQDQPWRLRLNDFPAEPMFTLLINGEAVLDFDDWPRAWFRPE